VIATERDTAARTAWQAEVAGWDAEQVVFLDETSTHTSMARPRGRAPRGVRVIGRVPRNHGPNVSCLAVLTPDGITAPLVIEGAIDGTVFQPWLREWRLPALRPGTTIVLDNLSVHRSPDVRKIITAADCHLRFLPAYSPDFNPIELAFSKLKTHLRGTASRTYDTLVVATGSNTDGPAPSPSPASATAPERCGSSGSAPSSPNSLPRETGFTPAARSRADTTAWKSSVPNGNRRTDRT
jgi:transposase